LFLIKDVSGLLGFTPWGFQGFKNLVFGKKMGDFIGYSVHCGPLSVGFPNIVAIHPHQSRFPPIRESFPSVMFVLSISDKEQNQNIK